MMVTLMKGTAIGSQSWQCSCHNVYLAVCHCMTGWCQWWNALQHHVPCCIAWSAWFHYIWHQHCNPSWHDRIVSMMKCSASVIAMLHLECLFCLWCRLLLHCSWSCLFGFGEWWALPWWKTTSSIAAWTFMMVVSWLQKETTGKIQVINIMVCKIIIAACADHCIQGPLPIALG